MTQFLAGVKKVENPESLLKERLGATISGMGYEYVGYSMLTGNGILRIFIDKVGGVTIDDCTRVSRQVGTMLDVEELIPGRYTLEVSSPGLNRPLFELEQYARFVGETIKVRSMTPIANQRNFEGQLIQIKDENIFLSVDGNEVIIPYSDIEKANVVASIR